MYGQLCQETLTNWCLNEYGLWNYRQKEVGLYSEEHNKGEFMKIDYKVKGDKVLITMGEGQWKQEYTIKEDGSLVSGGGMIFKKVK